MSSSQTSCLCLSVAYFNLFEWVNSCLWIYSRVTKDQGNDLAYPPIDGQASSQLDSSAVFLPVSLGGRDYRTIGYSIIHRFKVYRAVRELRRKDAISSRVDRCKVQQSSSFQLPSDCFQNNFADRPIINLYEARARRQATVHCLG